MNGEKEGSITDPRNMKTVFIRQEGNSKASQKQSKLDSRWEEGRAVLSSSREHEVSGGRNLQ